MLAICDRVGSRSRRRSSRGLDGAAVNIPVNTRLSYGVISGVIAEIAADDNPPICRQILGPGETRKTRLATLSLVVA